MTTAVTRSQFLAEISATFMLVFIGCGAVAVNDLFGGGLGHMGVSIAFGLVVAAMIYSVGNVSGAHINPAVTVGFYVAGRFPGAHVLPYISAQIVGALLAGAALRFLFLEHETLGATLPATDFTRTFIIEVMISFLLMFVVLNVSTGHQEKGIMAGAALGGVVTMVALVFGPVTGASMNPARSIGPGLVSGQVTGLWIYLIAPVIGTCLAAPACRLIQGKDCVPGMGNHSEN